MQRKCKGLALYKLLKQSMNPAILTSKCAQIECMNQDVLQILGCEGRCVHLLACKAIRSCSCGGRDLLTFLFSRTHIIYNNIQ